MMLQPLEDLGVAQWLTDSPIPWKVLVAQGLAGFATSTTVWFDPETADPYSSDDELMEIVVGIAAEHTRTPDELFFGLWDGWGELHDGSRIYSTARVGWLSRLYQQPSPPRIGPAFDEKTMALPRLELGDGTERNYLLFSGPAKDVGKWPTEPVEFDVPRTLPPASLTWPADQSWFIAADVDAEWMCVSGGIELAAVLAADPRLTTAPAVHGMFPTSRPL